MLSYISIGMALLAFLITIESFSHSLAYLGKKKGWSLLTKLRRVGWYRFLHLHLFRHNIAQDALAFTLKATHFFLYLLLGIYLYTPLTFEQFDVRWVFFVVVAVALLLFLTLGSIPSLINRSSPRTVAKLTALPATILMLPLLLPAAILLFFSPQFAHLITVRPPSYPASLSTKELNTLLENCKIDEEWDPIDIRLIQSVITFRDRITREVMVPRIDTLSLPADTTVKEAARILDQHGYSRAPVYKQSVDNIIGILMYKDLLHLYQDPQTATLLDEAIEPIVKKAIYAPETKKISHLLQDFRAKQVHMAIVVDEWGGTEGIITIEDILEEIVGEIADEYDTDEELYTPLTGNTWVIDTKMSINDLESELGVSIPQEGDYDTIGGYIYHCAGSIPKRGFTIHQENFILEVLKSDDRSISKVKIRALK